MADLVNVAIEGQLLRGVTQPLALFADQVLGGDLEIVEEQLVGLVVDHVRYRLDVHPGAPGFLDVDQEDGQPLALLLNLGERRGAGEQDHMRPGFGAFFGNLIADAAGSTGNQRVFAC